MSLGILICAHCNTSVAVKADSDGTCPYCRKNMTVGPAPPRSAVAPTPTVMPPRPLSVSVICWLNILAGVWYLWIAMDRSAVLSALERSTDPQAQEFLRGMNEEFKRRGWLPVSLQVAFMYTSGLVHAVTGIAMLSGRNWARLIYILWLVLTVAAAVRSSAIEFLGLLIVSLILVYFLSRPRANEFFGARS